GDVGVARAGRVDDLLHRRDRDLDHTVRRVDLAPLPTPGHRHDRAAITQRLDPDPGAAAEQLDLVVVAHHHPGGVEPRGERLRRQRGDLLGGGEDEAVAELRRLADVRRHRVGRVGGDHHRVDVGIEPAQVDRPRTPHRTGKEGGDLVVVEVGGDEAGGGGDVVAAERRGGVDPAALELGAVAGEVVADRGAEQRALAEQSQGVGDVRGGPAAAPLEAVDEEGDVEDVGLVGEDVLSEAPWEDHDGVEGDRAGHGDAWHGRIVAAMGRHNGGVALHRVLRPAVTPVGHVAAEPTAEPTAVAEAVELYHRTYTTLLRSSGETRLRVLESSHKAMGSSLHPLAASSDIDLGAFLYACRRLPPEILRSSLVVMGQSSEVFARHGYSFDGSTLTDAPGRRRRWYHDGGSTLAVLVASASDVDDLVPTLVAFQI